MTEEKFFKELENLLRDSIDTQDVEKVLQHYKDKLDEQITEEKRLEVLNNFRSPESIVKPILLMQNFSKRNEDSVAHSITIGFASLFADFKKHTTLKKKLMNIFIVIIIVSVVLALLSFSSMSFRFGFRLIFSLSIFDLPIKLLLLSISFTLFSIGVLVIQVAITSLRHIPYLGLSILRRLK